MKTDLRKKKSCSEKVKLVNNTFFQKKQGKCEKKQRYQTCNN